MIIVSENENIDPNKFPILNKYNDVIEKNIINYDEHYITISLITELSSNNKKKYIKLSFNIPKNINDSTKIKIMKHFKEAISLIPNSQ